MYLELDVTNIIGFVTVVISFMVTLVKLMQITQNVVHRVISQMENVLHMDIDRDGYIGKAARLSDVRPKDGA